MHEATLAAAHARLAGVRPGDYARTRNFVDGAVTGLSPFLTHGLLNLPEVLAAVNARQPLAVQHKLVYELGWRAYWRHVWQHRGDGILASLHEGPLPDTAYSHELPTDIRNACTGVPAIDMAVRTLYTTGTLHNHARMWLASYVVHLRKVHWRSGADWLYGHLLDGDLASNHLSWQWVAGTGSSKPYLFNADNVARHAPAGWHSPGTAVDRSYEALDRVARSPQAEGGERERPAAIVEPGWCSTPPAEPGAVAPDAAAVRGHDFWLVHPWNLGPLPTLPPGTRVLGLWVTDFHQRWPWSPARWQFVGQRMAALAPLQWHGSAADIGLALASARSVRSTFDPHLAPWLERWAECRAALTLFAQVPQRCDSFSRWWARVTAGVDTAAELLAQAEAPGW